VNESLSKPLIFRLIALGLTNEAIAERMKLSPSTIRHRVAQILDKLGVANRTEFATKFLSKRCSEFEMILPNSVVR
jgi:NarL family two-component system response regulator LiaR